MKNLRNRFGLLAIFYFTAWSSWAQVQSTEGSNKTQFFEAWGLIELSLVAIAIGLLILIVRMARTYQKMAKSRWLELNEERSTTSKMSIFVFAAITLPFQIQVSQGLILFILGVIAVELLVLWYLAGNLDKLLQPREELLKEAHQAEQSEFLPGIWAAQLWAMMNRSVALEKEHEIIREHDFDGIRELDNDLPPWWVWGFIFTIAFSVVYLWRYHVSQTAPLQEEELRISLVKAEEAIMTYRATLANQIDESNVEYNDDAAWLEKGALIYQQNCVACHGNYGEGGVGPNLTDDYWLHGPEINQIFKVVKYGVIEKGMTPWKELLTATQMAQVSSYVKSLRGSNPPNPKAPQGKLYELEPEEYETEPEFIRTDGESADM